jgi:hypothetical protein
MNQAHPHFMEFEVHITEALLFSYETAPQNGVQKEVSSLSFPGLDREGG